MSEGWKACDWVEDAGCYMTSCQKSFATNDDFDHPREWMKFCCFCGKAICFFGRQVPHD